MMFGGVGGGETYAHLNLRAGDVCRNCQINGVICRVCGHIYPPSRKYFYAKKGGKHGLGTACIPCLNGHAPATTIKRGRPLHQEA